MEPCPRPSVGQVGHGHRQGAGAYGSHGGSSGRGLSVARHAETQAGDPSGAKYRALLEAAPDAMVVVDERGEIVLLNVQAEKQFGYHRDELVGQPVTIIIPVGFAERLIADDLRSPADALAQQIGTGIELAGRRKNGSEFPIDIMLSPLETAEGILVTAAIRNISARKAAEGQLLQAQKLESVGRLAGGIAHDFNNMLFVINGHAGMLDQDLMPERRAALDLDHALGNIQAIREAGERAARLTAQLLAFSRQRVVSPKVIDLNAAVEGLEPMMRELIGTDVRLVVELSPGAGHVRLDAGQLDQILVNLMVNARDAMPDGGRLTIETADVTVDEPHTIEHFDLRAGPYALLAVSDTGTGMDRSVRERIFEPFFTTKEPGKGTGLGLATAYGIVRQAGGHIWVYSEPGIGSTFKIYLPRVDPIGLLDAPAVPVAPDGGTGTVLVVEDERDVRDVTTQMLTRAGYHVIAVADGTEAIARLARIEEPIDVLVTDIVMPRMSGIELADQVMDAYPRVGVVLLSGFTAETLQLERVTTRGAAFVPKPVTSGQLVAAVEGARATRPSAAPASPGPRHGEVATHDAARRTPILVVDDDPAVRELVATYLAREGFEVREAASGEAALALLDTQAIDLVILDMGLPGMSGLDVLRALRHRPRTANLPVTVLTGMGDEYPLAASLGLGADDYVTKPVRLDALAALVRARLRSRRAAADQAKAQGEALYRALVEHAADGVLVSDQTGRYVEANQAICRMLGYSRDELLAMFTPSLSASDDPLTPLEMDERLAETASGTGLVVQRRYRRSDGSSLPVEVGFSQLPDGRLQRNVRDITARLAAEAERAQLVAAVEQTADAVWIKDADGSIVTYVNHSFSKLYGYAPDEIVGLDAGILNSGRQERPFFDAIWSLVAAGKTWSGSIVNRHRDGGLVEVEAVISGIRDPSGRLVSYMQTDRDVTRERALERAQERGVREREAISAALARIDPAASAGEIAAAACATINGLPGVDSTMAVALDDVAGTVLAVVGQLVATLASGTQIAEDRAAYLRERGSAGPWYEAWRPDPGAGGWREAVTAAGLVAAAYAPLRGPRGVIGIVGIGSHDPATAGSLVEHMPALASFASTLGALLVPRLEDRWRNLEGHSAIKALIDTSAFAPFFQPIVDLLTDTVVGYEALSRFTDGDPPDVKFTVADRVGLGIELEVATMRAAVESAAVLPADTYLSLNVSPALIGSGKLDSLLGGVERPVVLEITEHVEIDDYPALRASLAALVPAVRLAVDDAGAGYASLRHILELAPDFVKLDIGLIRGIDADPARQALIAGMGYFAVKRRIRLIAEGIETPAELESLRSLGISFGQGYLLGRPQDGRVPGPWPSKVAPRMGPAQRPRSRRRH